MAPSSSGVPSAGEGADDAESVLFPAVDRLLAQGRAYPSLTAGVIADEAGISRAAFYVAFQDTTALALRMLDVRTAGLVAGALEWIEGDGDRDDLARMMVVLVAGFRDHALLLKARQELSGTDAAVRGFWVARIEGIADVLAHRLRRDGRDGEAGDAAATASWIAWGTERMLTVHIQSRPAGSDADMATGIAGAIWGAMHQSPA